jgi:hypothetical protein
MPNERQRFIDATHKFPSRPRVYCLGDSWFQYPLLSTDVHKVLRTALANQAIFYNNSVAGQTSAKIKSKLKFVQAELGEWGSFDALLVSMGGNDIVGDELAQYVKTKDEAQSPAHPFGGVPTVVDTFLRLSAFAQGLDFLRDDFLRVMQMRNAVAPACAILFHTYDYPFPNGKPFKLGPIEKGPWMQPAFIDVGLTNLADQRTVAIWLIDQFAALLSGLANASTNVHLIDSRGALPNPSDWGNEIHPNTAGFKHIAMNFWLPTLRGVLGV